MNLNMTTMTKKVVLNP